MPESPEFVITLSHNKSNDKQVTLAVTLGRKSLEKGYRTAILLMLDGIYIGSDGYVGTLISASRSYLARICLKSTWMVEGN